MVAKGAARAALRPCGWDLDVAPYAERIDVLPSRRDLEVRDSEAHQMGAVQRLLYALEGVDDDYDWTLIDCRPSLGHLSQNAMVAADLALLSVNAESDAITAAVDTHVFIRDNAAMLGNAELELAGVVTNAYRGKTGLHSFRFEDTLPKLFTAEQIWTPTIPQAVRFADAVDAAQPILASAREHEPLFLAHAERLVARYGSAA